jgi:PAS domain S-box-containing protein
MPVESAHPDAAPPRGLLEIVQAIAAGEDLRQTLRALCHLLEAELGPEHGFRASILNLDAAGRLSAACAPTLPDAYLDALEGVAIGPEVGSCGAACFHGETVVSEDIAQDPKWDGYRDLALAHGLRACWSQPVRDAADRVTACLGVYSPRPSSPTDAQRRFLIEAATIAGLAVDRHLKERENAATAERLNLMLEANEDGVWDWDVPSGEVYLSPRLVAMLGYGPDELPGHVSTWESLVHSDDRPWVMHVLHDHLDGHTPYYETEHRCRTGAGGWMWILDRGKVVERDGDGRPVRMVGTHTDITRRKDQERQLRHNKARYKAIINTAADAIITMGEDRRITEVNPATARMFGWASGELIGQPVEVLMPTEERGEHVSWVERYVGGGPARVVGLPGRQLTAQHRDGHRFPVSLSITEWWIDGQRNFTGIIRDISEMVAADTRLRASEAEARKLALVADRTTNAVLITDAHSRIEWANRGFEQQTGYTLAEVRGCRPGDVLAGPATDREEFDRVRARANRGEGYSTEILSYTKHGQPYWVAIDCQPVHDEWGRIERFVTIQNDITRHRDLERRLLRAEQVAKLGNWVIDPATLRLSWSDELFRILEMPADAGEPNLEEVLSCYHPDDRREVETMLQHTLETGEELSYRRRLLIGDRVKWIDVRCAGELDANGRVVGVFGICQDVTGSMERERELLEARRHAETANRAKSEFLATMSHELRTPLNAIIGYTEMMAEEMLGPLGNDRYRGYSRNVLESGRYLHSMIENVLNLSRMEAERVEPSIQPVVLDEVLARALSMIQPTADKKGVQVSRDTAGDTALAFADPHLLQQVLVACLDNAVKFTPDGGRVWLAVDAGAEAVRVQVHDTGIGIPEKHLANVIKPFYRVHDTAATAGNTGTGIGLALADRLARAMGGQLEIASKPEQGTVVTVALPTGDPQVVALRRPA